MACGPGYPFPKIKLLGTLGDEERVRRGCRQKEGHDDFEKDQKMFFGREYWLAH